MAPRKKKARSQSNAIATTDEELGKLVKWLTREQLETFVLNAVHEGALSDSDLWKSVPEHAEIRKPNISVSEGSDRMGTGVFDMLDQSVMREIFSYCGLLTKIACVSSICKAWRGYKNIPGLFTDLSEHLVASKTISTYNKAGFLMDLLDFVPDEFAVESLRLATARSDDHNFCGKVFKRLGQLKKDAEKSGQVFHLKKIVLQGEKLSLTVLKKLVASGICSSLSSLEFDDVYGSRKKLPKDNAVPILLAACSNLEELKIPASVMDERNLTVHASALVEARGGAPSLLKVLDMSSGEGYSWHRNAVTWAILSKLGTQLPLLEVLKLKDITRDTPIQCDPKASQYVEATPPLSHFLVEPFAPLPNLRFFQINRITASWDYQHELAPRYVPTLYMTKIVTRIMEAAPALESFTFGHGKHASPTKKALRTGRLIVPPLPTFELAMMNLPKSLKSLTLSQVLVQPGDFMGLDLSGFEKLQFHDCGDAMNETIEMLHQKAPHQFELTTTTTAGNTAAVRITRIG